MRIRTPGKINDHLYLLGLEESCTYLLEGRDESMLINGGLNYAAPVLLDQFKHFGISEKKIRKILLLHAHFDHIGIVPFFKRRRPEIEVLASARAWQILSMPKAIATINQFSRDVAAHVGRLHLYDRSDQLDWSGDLEGRSVFPGELLDLGGLSVEIFATPGHSSCSISAYVPELKVLFPSDGGGVPFRETKVVSGNSNFTQLQQSLEKLVALETEVVCADHYGYVVGDEARRYIRDTSEKAALQRNHMETLYRRTGSVEKAAEALSEEFLKDNFDHLTPPDLFRAVSRQMMRHIAHQASK